MPMWQSNAVIEVDSANETIGKKKILLATKVSKQERKN
jgi:hypothetical protein